MIWCSSIQRQLEKSVAFLIGILEEFHRHRNFFLTLILEELKQNIVCWQIKKKILYILWNSLGI